jgi:hypothetical protein
LDVEVDFGVDYVRVGVLLVAVRASRQFEGRDAMRFWKPLCRLRAFHLSWGILAVSACTDTTNGPIEPPDEPFRPPLVTFFCCTPPNHGEATVILGAIDYLWDSPYAHCREVASEAEFHLMNNDIWIDPGGYPGITYWAGYHPNDTYSDTSLGAGFELWPPLFLELVLAHEFIHSTYHIHMDQEDAVQELAEMCIEHA